MQGPIFESMMHKIDYVTDEDINVATSTESWSSGEDGLDQELDDIDYPRGSSNGRFDLFQDMGLSVMDNFMPSGNTGSNNELRACFSISTPCDSKMNGLANPIPSKPYQVSDIVSVEDDSITKHLPAVGELRTLQAPTTPTATIPQYMKVKVEQPSTKSTSDALHPKHVYKTVSGTYRVQMSRGCKSNPNKKFSRNARMEEDALWLCECALVLIDQPGSFKDMLRNSNYHYLVQNQMVSCPEDFIQKLVDNMSDLSARSLLSSDESSRLKPLLQALVSSVGMAASSSLLPMDRSSFSITAVYYDDNKNEKDSLSHSFLYSFRPRKTPKRRMDPPRSPCKEWQDIIDCTQSKRRRMATESPLTGNKCVSPVQQTSPQYVVCGPDSRPLVQ